MEALNHLETPAEFDQPIEGWQALFAAGFDLACGFLYMDRRRLDMLVHDLMEVARPAVDERVLAFLQTTTFHAADFTRVSDGSCRLHPQLARAIVVTCDVSLHRMHENAAWLRAQLLC
jgi:CRISPR/Cas system-associated endonuclease Cas1